MQVVGPLPSLLLPLTLARHLQPSPTKSFHSGPCKASMTVLHNWASSPVVVVLTSSLCLLLLGRWPGPLWHAMNSNLDRSIDRFGPHKGSRQSSHQPRDHLCRVGRAAARVLATATTLLCKVPVKHGSQLTIILSQNERSKSGVNSTHFPSSPTTVCKRRGQTPRHFTPGVGFTYIIFHI